jgi:solute:Na+ symporter, SSS family
VATVSRWGRLVGFDRNFTRGDKWAAGGIFAWACFFAGLVLVGTAWNFISPWSEAAWSTYGRLTAIGAPIVVAVVTGLWFTWGAIRDLRDLFARLRRARLDPTDNGVVSGPDLPAAAAVTPRDEPVIALATAARPVTAPAPVPPS